MAMTVSIARELYLDDVLVYGDSEPEFLKNLRQVYARFRKQTVILKPKKCAFGMTKKEFVGHTISQERVSFSAEKLQKALYLPRLVTQPNYVRNHSDNFRPLIMHRLQMTKNSNF
jgi:hypothetical protein